MHCLVTNHHSKISFDFHVATKGSRSGIDRPVIVNDCVGDLVRDHVAMNEKSFNYHVVCHHLFIKKKSLVDSNILTFFSNTYCRLNMDGDRFLGKQSDPLIMIFKIVTSRSIYASVQL